MTILIIALVVLALAGIHEAYTTGHKHGKRDMVKELIERKCQEMEAKHGR